MSSVSIDRARAAVLVMDFQADIVARLGAAAAPVVERAGAVVAAARSAGVPVVYVVVGFRRGYPELNPTNPIFAPIVQANRFLLDPATPPGSDVHEALRPLPGDVVVLKHRVSAFAGTDLDMILRARSIDTLVLAGLATSGVVLSTVRHAADADYRLVVVSDACGDADAEVHRVLTEKIFPRQATVVTAATVIEGLR